MTKFEALKQALILAITAPTEKKCLDCSNIASGIAWNMSEFEIARAKKLALEFVTGNEDEY